MSTDTHRRGGWLMRLLLVVGLISGSVAVGTVPATAASYPKAAGYTTSGNVFYGNYNGSGSERWYCGDPSMGGRYIMQPSEGSPSYGELKTATSWTTRNGSAMSASEVRQLAWVLAAEGNTGSNKAAAEADWAIRDLVGNGSSKATPQGGSYAAGGKKILADAKKFSGPYSIPIQLEKTSATRVLVRTYRPRSGDNRVMEGFPGTLTVSGPAVFGANQEKSIKAYADGTSRELHVTGSGTIKVTAKYTGLPATKLYYRNGPSTAYQRALVGGKKTDVSGSDSLRVALPSTPPPADRVVPLRVTTSTSKLIARPGDSITDRILVDSSDAPRYAGTVTGGLYVTGGTERVGALLSFNVTKSGWYTSPAVRIPTDAERGAKYTWRWSFPAWTDGATTVNAFRTPDNVPSETTTVDVDFAPEIETLISNQSARAGEEVTDSAWISGVAYVPGTATSPAYGWSGTVTASLYAMPVEDGDEPIGSVTYEVDSTDDAHWETVDGVRQTRRDAPYVSPPVELPANARPGTSYTWVQSIDEWTGEEPYETLHQVSVTTPAGLPEETTTVPKATPSYVTQVSDQLVTLGESITDTITVTGLYEGEPIEIEWELYGPYAEAPALTDTCEGDPVASGTLTVDENGDVTTPAFTPEEVGYYTYVERNAETAIHEAFATKCGEVSETTLVKSQPAYVTQISNQETKVGAQVHDTIDVSGLVRGADPLEIKWELYGPYPEAPALTDTCEGDPFASGTVTATGNGEIVTEDVELTAAGYYTYVESSEATKAYHAASTKCGEVSETTVAKAQPSYVTQVSDQRIVVGETISDTIMVSGMVDGSPLDIKWELYGPYAEKPTPPQEDTEFDGVCEGEPVATGTVTATANGEISTPEVKITEAGWYTYVESNQDEGLHNYFATRCGEVTETFFAAEPPPATPPTGTPPATRPPSAPPIVVTGGSLLGAVVMAGGALLAGAVWVGRRRRAHQDASSS